MNIGFLITPSTSKTEPSKAKTSEKGSKKRKYWTENDERLLIDLAVKNEALKKLKGKVPSAYADAYKPLTWREIAAKIPDRSEYRCIKKWNSLVNDHKHEIFAVIKEIAEKVGLTEIPDVDQYHPKKTLWSQEEKDLLIDLALKKEAVEILAENVTPEYTALLTPLSWDDIAHYFPNRSSTKCCDEWRQTLKQNNLHKINAVMQEIGKEIGLEEIPEFIPLKLTEKVSIGLNRIHRKRRAESPSAMEEGRKRLKVNPDQQIQPLDPEFNKFQCLNTLISYKAALNQLWAIPMPALEAHKTGAVRYRDEMQTNYDKLMEKVDEKGIEQKLTLMAQECQRRVTVYDTLYHHYFFYNQTNSEITQLAKCAELYLDLLSGKIDKMHFEQEVVTLETNFHHLNINTLLSHYLTELNRYAPKLGLPYSQLLDEVKDNINFELSLLPRKAPEQNWTEAIMWIRNAVLPIQQTVDRMGEMVTFLKTTDQLPSLAKLESSIIARLRNEITAEEFSSAVRQAI